MNDSYEKQMDENNSPLTTFEDFVEWERNTDDSIDLKKTYIDLVKDLNTGLLLSQIIYWYLPNQVGETKLRVKVKGRLCLAKARYEWWDEIRLSPGQVDRAKTRLVSAGICTIETHKFRGLAMDHYLLNTNRFLDLLNNILMNPKSNRFKPQQRKEEEKEPEISIYGDVDGCLSGVDENVSAESRQRENRNSQKRNSYITETTTKTTCIENNKENLNSFTRSLSLLQDEYTHSSNKLKSLFTKIQSIHNFEPALRWYPVYQQLATHLQERDLLNFDYLDYVAEQVAKAPHYITVLQADDFEEDYREKRELGTNTAHTIERCPACGNELDPEYDTVKCPRCLLDRDKWDDPKEREECRTSVLIYGLIPPETESDFELLTNIAREIEKAKQRGTDLSM